MKKRLEGCMKASGSNKKNLLKIHLNQKIILVINLCLYSQIKSLKIILYKKINIK